MLLTTYECDSEKNVLCPKDCCQKECFATTRLEFAKLDEDGQPIVHEVWEMPDWGDAE